jgi:hypothetical protein
MCREAVTMDSLDRVHLLGQILRAPASTIFLHLGSAKFTST